MSWVVSKKKIDFLGKRSFARAENQRPDRKQLVALLPDDHRTGPARGRAAGRVRRAAPRPGRPGADARPRHLGLSLGRARPHVRPRPAEGRTAADRRPDPCGGRRRSAAGHRGLARCWSTPTAPDATATPSPRRTNAARGTAPVTAGGHRSHLCSPSPTNSPGRPAAASGSPSDRIAPCSTCTAPLGTRQRRAWPASWLPRRPDRHQPAHLRRRRRTGRPGPAEVLLLADPARAPSWRPRFVETPPGVRSPTSPPPGRRSRSPDPAPGSCWPRGAPSISPAGPGSLRPDPARPVRRGAHRRHGGRRRPRPGVGPQLVRHPPGPLADPFGRRTERPAQIALEAVVVAASWSSAQ